MHPDRRELLLKVCLAGAIMMMAGPELLPAIEMTTLLELLGATLFLTAFSSALRLLAQDVARSVFDLLIPPGLAAMYRQTTRPLAKGGIAGYLCLRGLYIAMMALVVAMFVGSHVA
jgi:hypothetical protein